MEMMKWLFGSSSEEILEFQAWLGEANFRWIDEFDDDGFEGWMKIA